MALGLLDGVTSSFNFETDVNSTDLTTANASGGTIPATGTTNMDSWKCVATGLSIDITQDFLTRMTFCAGRWRGRVAGVRDVEGIITGFQSKGAKISDPMYMFATTKGVPWIATLDTGCTISGAIVPGRYHMGMQSFANSEMGLNFATDGTFISPATTWSTS